MYRVPERLYKTADGRLVGHNDPEAAFLAFPAGMELSDEEADRFGVRKVGQKLALPPENKLARRAADKSITKENTQ